MIGLSNFLQNKDNFKGECFVFDNRVSINKNLLKGKYFQCYGCRSPITKKEMKSRHYKKGISCPKCYFEISKSY